MENSADYDPEIPTIHKTRLAVAWEDTGTEK